MAEYTTELRRLIEGGYDMGLNDYPIYDESHREELNQLITATYYMREIGYETPELFCLYFRNWLMLNMPVYNQLYKSVDMLKNPLTTVDVETVGQESSETKSAGQSVSDSTTDNVTDSESKAVNYAMPQTRRVAGNDYASSEATSDSASTSKGQGHASDSRTDEGVANSDMLNRTTGRVGVTEAALVLEYREAIINVDQLIIDELSQFFVGVFNPNPRGK